jgi:hypothetical protein
MLGLLLRTILSALLLLGLTLYADAEQIRVKYPQGSLHAFMILRSEDGKAIGVGDWDQKLQGREVSSHLKLRFDDGSIYEDTTIYSQRSAFRILSDHLLESGPIFKDPVEVWIDSRSGQVKVRQARDGKDEVTTHRLNIPGDLTNGIIPTVIGNLPDSSQHTFSMLVATPKPRIVKLVVTPQPEDAFSIQTSKYKAKTYQVHIDIGGVAGAVASLVGKQPPDTHVWVLKGDIPIFLRSVGPLSPDAPVVQIELSAPMWSGSHK